MSAPRELLLDLQKVSAGYGALKVLHDVSLHVGKAEVVGLLGANGAGKSTLVRTISGHLRVRSGTIRHGGVDLTRLAPHRIPQHGVAVVLEARNLFGDMTVAENLGLALRNGRQRVPRFSIKDVLNLFPVLTEKYGTPAKLLSGGQQQMVAIARALLLQPDVLVLDEPSTGLAPKIIKDIVEVLQQLRSEGMSMLLIEQNVSMAAQLTDRAYVLSLGRIVYEVAEGTWKNTLESGALADAYLGGGMKSVEPRPPVKESRQ
ncbi:ABC transporter ATP-binding protein [Variovorax sp. dw_954]|uniref:ABC transporter ATP-binding protein n=1 Tax=Variovorax sp. dw_954 TaxID=2720078 RepID=UPI001BD6A045|nr:ABC transporter ATP-binding protein [Variovorax sp. dw_954]